MALDLANFEDRTKEAIIHFWKTRESSIAKNRTSGKADQGNRSAVTGGKTMDGFINLIEAVVEANGLSAKCVLSKGKSDLTIPGYFRPTKNWDILILDNKNLVGIIEFKSQVGSFGNNFNNRCEEALGCATDVRTALKENIFKIKNKPFLGYLMLIEDCHDSRRVVRSDSKHYEVDDIFKNTCYLDRYNIFCERLVREGLYDTAALLVSPKEEGLRSGAFEGMGQFTSLKSFVSSLAAAIASYSSTVS